MGLDVVACELINGLKLGESISVNQMSVIDIPALIKSFRNSAHFVISTWKEFCLGNMSEIFSKWSLKTKYPISLLMTDKGF